MMPGMTTPKERPAEDRLSQVNFACPNHLLDRIDAFARSHMTTRSAAIRVLIVGGLDAAGEG